MEEMRAMGTQVGQLAEKVDHLAFASDYETYLNQISERGVEVDKAKIEVMNGLSPPKTVKDIRSFLGHAGFYRRFIQDFSMIARPMTKLLFKEAAFNFDWKCLEAFKKLKDKLVSAPIVQPPDWDLPFEIMCDASDYAV
ncbi:PREDICTED: uncharacterized mitochondrial protein AtMg00860-like [Brassica oleracea var. oleracea]|uniref:uncharacterized mitochondrial protein AtMg00860-like n=1 Tax=Brassica oleracea var. oleracea TaxID=109376 RepID=UPI0006A6AD01|nr:PREDICTED: uncharacterized mitochondrial protein AtMg00860-like [Brassica oleracea var. oleracea]